MTFDDSADIRPLIKRRIDNLLEDVEGWVYQITEDEHQDFGPVLAARFSKMTQVFSSPRVVQSRIGSVGALNIYLAVLDHEERLLDIADEEARDEEFHKFIGEHQFQADVISSLDLEPYRGRSRRERNRADRGGGRWSFPQDRGRTEESGTRDARMRARPRPAH